MTDTCYEDAKKGRGIKMTPKYVLPRAKEKLPFGYDVSEKGLSRCKTAPTVKIPDYNVRGVFKYSFLNTQCDDGTETVFRSDKKARPATKMLPRTLSQFGCGHTAHNPIYMPRGVR